MSPPPSPLGTVTATIDMTYVRCSSGLCRIGLIAKEGQRPTPFRVYTNNYKLSPTYPAKFVVPSRLMMRLKRLQNTEAKLGYQR